MDLQHTFTVPVGVDAAWTAFNDLESIAPCFPGATITSVTGDEFKGAAKVKLGPISLQYTGKGRWASRDAAAYRAVIEASGTDKRGNGTASATITARLEPEGAGTRVVVDTDLRITGRPAQFGRGVIQDVGNKILDQFAACLSERMGQAVHAEVSTTVLGEEPVGAGVGGAGGAGGGPVAEDPTPPDVPVGDAAGEAGGPSVEIEAADVPDVPTAPLGAAPPAAAAPAPSSSGPTPGEPVELDLGDVVGPVLLRRFGPTAAAVVVTAVITWIVARRRS